ncbi:hypothetical protein COO60DRAFT_399172 [Scenedesmus sp. NREL 46B-D3]|nr:hypothetical protein COO60DRAFT_399172 [Scenedesmus sp. NREL 46B-D3]
MSMRAATVVTCTCLAGEAWNALGTAWRLVRVQAAACIIFVISTLCCSVIAAGDRSRKQVERMVLRWASTHEGSTGTSLAPCGGGKAVRSCKGLSGFVSPSQGMTVCRRRCVCCHPASVATSASAAMCSPAPDPARRVSTRALDKQLVLHLATLRHSCVFSLCGSEYEWMVGWVGCKANSAAEIGT